MGEQETDHVTGAVNMGTHGNSTGERSSSLAHNLQLSHSFHYVQRFFFFFFFFRALQTLSEGPPASAATGGERAFRLGSEYNAEYR